MQFVCPLGFSEAKQNRQFYNHQRTCYISVGWLPELRVCCSQFVFFFGPERRDPVQDGIMYVFTMKEADMQDKPVYLTRDGLAKLEAELKHLREVVRVDVAERIRASKELSDTDDNGEYEEAKNEQAFVEGRILTVEVMLANASIIDEEDRSSDLVRIGSRVTVSYDDGEKVDYVIVGSAEANPREGRISNESPVGRALLGHRPGETVEVAAPDGVVMYKIESIS
jgi:transcription elongation factor GreA